MLNSKFWARYFKVYDVLNLLIPYQKLLETICDELEIKPGERILEAGCGTGNLALKIKARKAEVIGLDNCQEALNIYQKKDLLAKLVLADLREKLSFPDNYFDKIVSNNTLYIIPQEKQLNVLQEFYRILKPKGMIVLSNPRKKAKPQKIYLNHLKNSVKTNGYTNTLKETIKLINPTFKIFYFNFYIKKELKKDRCNFFNFDEQRKLLMKSGFTEISETKLVYAEQNILNHAFKPS